VNPENQTQYKNFYQIQKNQPHLKSIFGWCVCRGHFRWRTVHLRPRAQTSQRPGVYVRLLIDVVDLVEVGLAPCRLVLERDVGRLLGFGYTQN